jgi:hypothetical protein
VWGHGAAGVDGPLTAQIVTAIFRKVEQWIGLEKQEWERISGHSARVDAARDLLGLNFDLSSVMQAGRWRDTRMRCGTATPERATKRLGEGNGVIALIGQRGRPQEGGHYVR